MEIFEASRNIMFECNVFLIFSLIKTEKKTEEEIKKESSVQGSDGKENEVQVSLNYWFLMAHHHRLLVYFLHP